MGKERLVTDVDSLIQRVWDLEEENERLNGLLTEECRVAHIRRTGPHTYFLNVSEQRWQGVDERDNAPN